MFQEHTVTDVDEEESTADTEEDVSTHSFNYCYLEFLYLLNFGAKSTL